VILWNFVASFFLFLMMMYERNWWKNMVWKKWCNWKSYKYTRAHTFKGVEAKTSVVKLFVSLQHDHILLSMYERYTNFMFPLYYISNTGIKVGLILLHLFFFKIVVLVFATCKPPASVFWLWSLCTTALHNPTHHTVHIAWSY
jgi:hypothetical protein